MRFSFIIPSLNEEDYIGLCVRSIQDQSHPADEVVVVDNGSIDRTSEIAKRLGCEVVVERQRGISHARNRGASAAKGDVLCFIDVDGVLSKDWVKEASKALLKPGIHFAVGLNVFSHEHTAKAIWYNIYTVIVYSALILSQFLLHRPYLAGNNLAIRRELFWRLGGFEPVIGEDYWLSKKLWQLGGCRGAFIPSMVIRYSSRGFDEYGYLRTLGYWMRNTWSRTSQSGYTHRTKDNIC